ncbi:MAG: FtsX-like permease family protein [Rhodothermaceae bacterium]|nr:FtsX-like permease family protein [Rhodothermaceae bacterium]
MIKNYLKIAYRSLLRHPGYAFINVFGFSIGLVCCLLILLYVRHELSYDRYHEKADRMYRVTIDAMVGGQEIKAPLAAAPFAESLVNNFPEVEDATRIFRSAFVGMDEISVEYEENTFLESRFKEVGIRKVVGASALSIVLLFSTDFLKRITISFLIGIPFAMYVMDQWLGRFAYRTDITWDVFIVPGIAALVISLGTISYHAIRAALMNPIDTLRYE